MSLLLFGTAICAQKTVHIVQVGDIHGWIYGHKDRPELGDLATVYSYYQNVQANLSSDPLADVLLVDAGDDCEGTGLSDLPDPKCSEIYRQLFKMPFDSMVLGNHDLSSEEAMRSLHDDFLPRNPDKFITTNVYWKETGERFGDMLRFKRLKNGVGVLMFGFMYTGATTYPTAEVRSMEETVRSEEFRQKVLELGNQTDLVVMSFHQGTGFPDVGKAVWALRDVFAETLNYDVPIHVVCGHTHLARRLECPYKRDHTKPDQCFNTEAGKYLERLEHTVWTLDAQNVENARGSFTGSK